MDLPPGEIPTRFTLRQRALLTAYQGHLSSLHAPSEEDIDRFQETLCSVLFREKEQEIDLLGKLACPVQSFMAILALRGIGVFAKAGLVTQPISRLLYLSRCSVLLLAHANASGGDSKRFMTWVLIFSSPLSR